MSRYGIEIGKVGSQFQRLINKLKTLQNEGKEELAKAVQKSAQLGLEVIADEIHHVRPHSGQHRVVAENKVTDLIDTGHYLNSWNVTSTGPFSAKIATNNDYALALEFGKHTPEEVKSYTYTNQKGKTVTVKSHVRNINTRGFYVAAKSAVKIRRLFKQELKAALKRAVERRQPG